MEGHGTLARQHQGMQSHARPADGMACGTAQPNCKPDAQPITVTLIDSCPGCSFNIPVPLFSTLADAKWGVIPVSYQQVRMQMHLRACCKQL